MELAAKGNEIAQKFIVKGNDDQQKTVGIVGPRFPHLPGIKDEILTQRGKHDFFARITKIFQRAAEELPFGEDRKSGGASGFQGFGQSGRIERFTNDAARGRSGLEFRDDVQSIAGKRSGKITYRRRFRQYTLAMIDLGTTRFQHAVKDGASVGMGSHRDKFVC